MEESVRQKYKELDVLERMRDIAIVSDTKSSSHKSTHQLARYDTKIEGLKTEITRFERMQAELKRREGCLAVIEDLAQFNHNMKASTEKTLAKSKVKNRQKTLKKLDDLCEYAGEIADFYNETSVMMTQINDELLANFPDKEEKEEEEPSLSCAKRFPATPATPIKSRGSAPSYMPH